MYECVFDCRVDECLSHAFMGYIRTNTSKKKLTVYNFGDLIMRAFGSHKNEHQIHSFGIKEGRINYPCKFNDFNYIQTAM